MHHPCDSTPNLRQRAYRDLKHQIIQGDLLPGQRLSLRKTAQSLGMSMAPVGQAFRELQRDGLLEMETGWGARVRQLDIDDLRSQHILRTAVECEAIRHCTAQATASQLSELSRLAAQLDERIDNQADPQRVFELDSQFHLRIAQLSGVASLVEVLRANQFVRMLARGSRLAHGLKRPPRQHLALVKAIRTRDGDAAAHAMRAHCIRSMELQLSCLARSPLDDPQEIHSWTS